jgi:peptidoglycan/xylan/chitin deacetylase (PgdA/CDA1 family)
MVKAALKSALQSVVASLAPRRWRLGGEPRLLVLMYHRVLPRQHPDRASEQPGMFVSPETLAMNLRVAAEHFQLVHLDDWVARARAGEPLPPRACAVSFDDGWLDNYQHAWPVLRAAGVPATIFIVSSLVGTRYAFWPNRLARMLGDPRSSAATQALLARIGIGIGSAGPSGAQRDAFPHAAIDPLIEACKRAHADAQMNALLDEVAPPGADAAPRDLMDWNEIRTVSAGGQIRIGSHTRRHTRLLPDLSASAADDEIVGSIGEIEAQVGMRPVSFCYPNGDHSPAATALVARHYRCAVTTRRGWNRRASDPYLLARVGLHDEVAMTRAAFLARLAGVG